MNIKINSISLFEMLSPKLGRDETKKLVETLEVMPEIAKETAIKIIEHQTCVFATKEDVFYIQRAMKEDIIGLLKIMKDDIIGLQKEINNNLKWTIATIIAGVGILIAVMKFLNW